MKSSYLNTYSKKLFCQKYCFNFQSNQESFFVKHIKFEKRKALKKDNYRINANSAASYKMVEFFDIRRGEKRNRRDFNWEKLLMYTVWKH